MLAVKVKSAACYSAAYMSQTRDQKHFTVFVVAADWHYEAIHCPHQPLDPQCS